MWIDPAYRLPLERSGLAGFCAVMNTAAGTRLRALPDRENWRLELRSAADGICAVYLKKHHVRTCFSWLRARLGLAPGKTPGRTEARNVALLEACGIAAMRVVACGEMLNADGLVESFIMTQELTGFTQLDHFLRLRFPRRTAYASPGRPRGLRTLLHEVARVARRFHDMGFNHRDLYCCHFFIRESPAEAFRVHLIDLQRVEHRCRWRWRWLVKDLAQLAYSAPRERISCTDRMAFIKHYLGVDRLRPAHKRFIRRILAKQRQMERHLGAHP
jgi:heptose I phosphotransferase